MEINFTKTNKRKQGGGSLLSSILSLGVKALQSIAKTIGFAGLSAGVETGVKRLFGKGQTGGFFIPHENLNKLLPYMKLLTTKRMKDLIQASQGGSGLHIKPAPSQRGGF